MLPANGPTSPTSPPSIPHPSSVLRVLKLGLPFGASVCVHAAIACMFFLTAWSIRPGGEVGRARAEVLITVPTPTTQDVKPAAGDPTPAPPIYTEVPPPRLQGLATPSLSAPPSLRSSVIDVPTAGELLRSQDDSAIQGATFAGMGAKRAASVVYVVDASGAMITSLKFVLNELERSVRNLSSAQKFQVVLFRDRGGASMYEVFAPQGDPTRLVNATPANKASLREWLRTIAPNGRSNPLDGLKRGLKFDCDAIFLLSRSIRRSGGASGDGTGATAIGESASGVWGRGTAEILAELDKLNPARGRGQRRAVIKAIQFLEEDPTGTMQAIGEQHGDGPGSYSVVTLQMLGGAPAR
jgi:hypothetical protein